MVGRAVAMHEAKKAKPVMVTCIIAGHPEGVLHCNGIQFQIEGHNIGKGGVTESQWEE